MADNDKSLDDLLEELGEAQQRLLELPSDAFIERSELQRRLGALREQAGWFAQDQDMDRSSEELLAEFVSLRARLESITAQRINATAHHGSEAGLSPEMSAVGGTDRAGTGQVDPGMGPVQNAGRTRARIARIKAILADRGIDPDTR
ncbi:MAG: hypothetical protein GWP04_07475 [Gammaproteobacteria bacterium]|nr:hypothetical protein [Gammaproteobacteria bacterium]